MLIISADFFVKPQFFYKQIQIRLLENSIQLTMLQLLIVLLIFLTGQL